MIAQIPTATNAQLINFLVGGTGLLGVVYLVLCVWHKGREVLGRQHMLRVEPAEPVTLREVHQSVERIESRLGKLEARTELVNESVQRILGRLEGRQENH